MFEEKNALKLVKFYIRKFNLHSEAQLKLLEEPFKGELLEYYVRWRFVCDELIDEIMKFPAPERKKLLSLYFSNLKHIVYSKPMHRFFELPEDEFELFKTFVRKGGTLFSAQQLFDLPGGVELLKIYMNKGCVFDPLERKIFEHPDAAEFVRILLKRRFRFDESSLFYILELPEAVELLSLYVEYTKIQSSDVLEQMIADFKYAPVVLKYYYKYGLNEALVNQAEKFGTIPFESDRYAFFSMEEISEKIEKGEELDLEEQVQMLNFKDAFKLFEQYVSKHALCETAEQVLGELPPEFVFHYVQQGHTFADSEIEAKAKAKMEARADFERVEAIVNKRNASELTDVKTDPETKPDKEKLQELDHMLARMREDGKKHRQNVQRSFL